MTFPQSVDHAIVLMAITTLAVSTYLLLFRPRLARRLLIAELQMIGDNLAADLREGMIPQGHTVVESLGAFVGTALANPATALDETRSFLHGHWAEFLVGNHQSRLYPQPELSSQAVDLLSGYWELIGLSLSQYRDDGSALGFLHRWRQHRSLGPGLANFPQLWQQPRRPENGRVPEPALPLWASFQQPTPPLNLDNRPAAASVPEQPAVLTPRLRRPRPVPAPTAPSTVGVSPADHRQPGPTRHRRPLTCLTSSCPSEPSGQNSVLLPPSSRGYPAPRHRSLNVGGVKRQ